VNQRRRLLFTVGLVFGVGKGARKAPGNNQRPQSSVMATIHVFPVECRAF
jgi:hypothetical protein